MHIVTSMIKQRLEKIGLSIQEISSMELSCVIGEYEIDLSCVNVARQIDLFPEQREILIGDFVQKVYQHLLQNGVLVHTEIAVQQCVEQCSPRVISIENPELRKQHSFPWFQPVVPNHLGLAIVGEQEGIVRYFSPLQLTGHPEGLKGYQREAMLYMLRLLPKVEISVEQGIHILYLPDGLASSLVVILHRILQNREKDTQLWVATPARDILAYSVDFPTSLQTWSTEMYTNQPYPISPNIFAWSLSQSEAIYTHWLRK